MCPIAISSVSFLLYVLGYFFKTCQHFHICYTSFLADLLHFSPNPHFQGLQFFMSSFLLVNVPNPYGFTLHISVLTFASKDFYLAFLSVVLYSLRMRLFLSLSFFISL